MKIATLQFDPHLGEVERNMAHAASLLDASSPGHLDLLVLPELAFTGYNFDSLTAITPFLEPTAAGPTTAWAIETAQRGACYVMVGYPERSTQHIDAATGVPRNFNSVVVVSPTGAVVGNYRKSFLYYTDETWASEGAFGIEPSAKDSGPPEPFFVQNLPGLGNVGLGICMDINPYRFTAAWTAYEFATRVARAQCNLVVLSMAWLTRLEVSELLGKGGEPERPDMETVAYWLERFWPLIARAPEEEVVVVFANRCGIEGGDEAKRLAEAGKEDGQDAVPGEGAPVCYAGSSCVMRFQGGSVRMFERAPNEVAVMGKGEEGLLVVDTAQQAKFLLQQKAG